MWLWYHNGAVRGQNGLDLATWVLGYMMINRGRLVNYFLDTRSSLNLAVSSDQQVYWTTHGCLALALLSSTMHWCGDPTFAGRRMHASLGTAHRYLFAGMARVLNAVANMEQDHTKYDAAHLWCLFVGAQLERKEAPSDASRMWFNQAFATLARKMGLFHWGAVRRSLEDFLYIDGLEPLGSRWVDRTIAESGTPNESPGETLHLTGVVEVSMVVNY